MLTYFRLGPFLIQVPGIALLLGVWVGLFLTEREANRLHLKPNLIYNLVFIGIVSGIVGARLTYVVRYLSAYIETPLSLFAINSNTLSLYEGFLIGLGVAIFYGYRKKLPLRPTLDALAPGLALFLISIGLAQFLSGDAFGAPTNLPWSIYLWNDYRHPSQIYEIVAGSIIFLVVYKRPLGQPGQGINFLLVIILSAAARVFLEAFRGDSLIWGDGYRAPQVIGVLVLLGSLWLMRVWMLSPTYEMIQPTNKIGSDLI
jgi:phosphatidylglycerol:prolipoprotein diacylglycerol transferase